MGSSAPTRIGCDIGGVIIRSAEEGSAHQAFLRAAEAGEDTSSMFKDNFREVLPVQGSIESIGELVHVYGADNVFIISKCGKIIQDKSIKWMLHHNFFAKTGMHAHNVHFCLERVDKAPIAKGLQLTHFVDDREDVLSYMSGIVENRILFMPSWDVLPDYTLKTGILPAYDWDEVLETVRSSVG